jgi:hypothetical protein
MLQQWSFLKFTQATAMLLGLSSFLPTTANTATFTFSASNTGAITGSTRDLQFDIQGISDPIKAARLELRINYSAARELGLTLIEVPGAIELPLIPGSTGTGPSYAGKYVLSDTAVTTMQQLRPSIGVVPNVPSRAYQFGIGGVCLNLIGRFLEFDRNRNGPLTLRITRTPSVGGGGSGSIDEAVLIIDTDTPDQIMATGFEEPNEPIIPCRRPPLDLVFNGGVEGTQSPLAILSFGAQFMNWSAQQLSPPQTFGPVQLGTNRTPVYAGRFGGRSRTNFGFWDAPTGTLTFTTGAGGRPVVLPGDWVNTPHRVIPGDYDGDGVTDLAMAFFANNFWSARILFSKTGQLLDQVIDPRVLLPQVYSSNQIGFGPGQDSDFDGRDEILVYSQISPQNGRMRQLIIVPATPESAAAALFDGPSWGLLGDKLILGRWTTNPTGNRLGLMVARKNGNSDEWEWYRFPNTTPVIFGVASTDAPVSIDIDGDTLNDIAVFNRFDRRWFVRQSSDGTNVVLGPFGELNSLPLGNAQGIVAPLEF